jgi:hypothetical protein
MASFYFEAKLPAKNLKTTDFIISGEEQRHIGSYENQHEYTDDQSPFWIMVIQICSQMHRFWGWIIQ